ncbi:uncharacterized protein N7511_009121 [Penicillium nucicola]|uniref:uncharacterized protein n=1 Tax=Penicillium nucicola TaxID=1850975 RepID=UPI002544D995|nr:uncharacterized protein N7511_009121 [Penicillium nucicola]KAJ5747425.1 hypothetical protein N7511_009121 [Penicillium nucicola]
MFTSTIFTGLILGLAQVPSSFALPAAEATQNDFTISHVASDYFPHSKSDLSAFDVDVRYVGYTPATQAWLTSLDPHSGSSDEDKARMLTEAAYAKPYDDNDTDMASDVQAMLARIAGNSTTTSSSIQKRSTFSTSAAHAVVWTACGAFFSCVSGQTCTFSEDIQKAPRSHCESHGGSNCCISWSNYNVRAGFFSTTWTTCNEEVAAEGKTSASCEGYGSSDQGVMSVLATGLVVVLRV